MENEQLSMKQLKSQIEILDQANNELRHSKDVNQFGKINIVCLVEEKLRELKKLYRQEYLTRYGAKIAAFIYSNTIDNTSTGAYCTYAHEIEEAFELDKPLKDDEELRKEIEDRIYDYPGVSDLEVYEEDFNSNDESEKEWCYDLNMFTNYLPSEYDAGDDD